MTPSPPLVNSRLLICEGAEEKALVNQMVVEKMVANLDVLAIEDAGGAGGVDALPRCLKGLPSLSGFVGVKSLAIIVDGDIDSARAFGRVREALEGANMDGSSPLSGRLSIPDEAFERKTDGQIPVSCFLMPGDMRAGCLETLLIEIISELYPVHHKCVLAAINCGAETRVPEWPQQKIDKAIVRAALALIYRKNPAVSLTMLWRNDPTIIPVSHASLGNLVQFLNRI